MYFTPIPWACARQLLIHAGMRACESCGHAPCATLIDSTVTKGGKRKKFEKNFFFKELPTTDHARYRRRITDNIY